MGSSSSSGGPPAAPAEKLLRAWIVVCAIVGGLFAVSQLAEIPVRSALRGYDNTFNYLWLRSAMVDGDWDFRNDLAQCDTLGPDYRTSALTLPLTPAGRIPNKYGIGWAVVSLPFYLVADGIVAGGRALGLWSFSRDGWNPVYQICLQLGHLGLALCALWLAVRVVQTWIGPCERWMALGGVALVWAASPLIYYQTVNVSMSHGAAFFAVAVLAYALTRAETATDFEPSARWWWLAGAGWGLAVITRFQLGVFGLLVLVSLAKVAVAGRGWWRPIALFAAGAAPLAFLQLYAWKSVYGAWFVFSYGVEGEVFHWLRPALGQALFSPWHGLLYWHPWLAVGLVGLGLWARERVTLAVVLLSLAGLTIYLNSAWWCWWFASAFGSRGFDAALLPVMAGTACLLQRSSPRWRVALVTLAVLAGLWNFHLLLLFRVGAISRGDAVTWLEMFRAAAHLPAALSL